MNNQKNLAIKKILAPIIVLAFIATIFTGCTGPSVTTIKANGSSTVFPVANKCAENFNKQEANVQVEVGAPPVGSGGGIKLLGEGSVQIADASRPIKQSERDQYPNVDFYETSIAADGVAIIVSPDIYDSGTGVTGLTTAQVRGIYNGTITDWGEVGGPSGTAININERETGSGTRDTFMDAIFDDEDAETQATQSWSSNSDVQNAVAGASNAIGYVGLGYVSNSAPDITLDGVAATEATIIAGTYPISRSLYMYTDGEPTGDVKLFIDYILSTEGQAIVAEEGFIPVQ